jgi:hypothetical protein
MVKRDPQLKERAILWGLREGISLTEMTEEGLRLVMTASSGTVRGVVQIVAPRRRRRMPRLSTVHYVACAATERDAAHS